MLHAIGQSPRYEPFPAPVPGDGEAVVTVTAAALKPSDRLMASGVHYAPTAFPQVAGLDGVGRAGGRQPGGVPAPGAAVRRDGGAGAGTPRHVARGTRRHRDVTAAALANPGMAAWKTVVWEGELAAGQTALVLGATGLSGRIAAQLAVRQGARVVAAGRNQRVLDQLLARGAAAAVRVDRPQDELVTAIAAEGPYDLIVDYLWGAPAEAVLAALARSRAGRAPERIRYILVGMSAGEKAAVPAIALRAAPVQLAAVGSAGRPRWRRPRPPTPACSTRLPPARSSWTSTRCRSPRSRRPGPARTAACASCSCPDRRHVPATCSMASAATRSP